VHSAAEQFFLDHWFAAEYEVRPARLQEQPVAIVYAGAEDALIVTMTHLLGLCWSYDYEQTAALTPEQLAELIGRPHSTLYRHLKQLREMQWIHVDQAGRRIVSCPLVGRDARPADRQPQRRDRAWSRSWRRGPVRITESAFLAEIRARLTLEGAAQSGRTAGDVPLSPRPEAHPIGQTRHSTR
jgi:DNA-binding transcriptional ArsR family regulator